MYHRILLASAAALLLGSAVPAVATLVHSGDSTIDGSLCVGFDCSNNEPMGFATIKIEENNLRIAAADSSSVGNFPTRDWQIEFNSSSNGGGSYFMIRDCGNGGAAGSVDSTCGGTPALTIEGGADNESIHVDSSGNQGGNVGFGTAQPVVDVHILSGNTPTVRLQQDGTSGFTPQSWDLAGNESNFFIRDVTNGSALPFRIEPGTASNTLYLDNSERIGIGTTAPAAALHVNNGGATYSAIAADDMVVQDDGPARLVLVNTTATNPNWIFNSNNTLRISAGTDAAELTLDDGGDMTILGTLTQNSDKNNKMGIELVDPRAILDKVARLPVSAWTYKHDAEDGIRHIGPMAQDFYALFGTGASETGISTLDTSGVALAAIQALRQENANLRARLELLENRLAE